MEQANHIESEPHGEDDYSSAECRRSAYFSFALHALFIEDSTETALAHMGRADELAKREGDEEDREASRTFLAAIEGLDLARKGYLIDAVANLKQSYETIKQWRLEDPDPEGWDFWERLLLAELREAMAMLYLEQGNLNEAVPLVQQLAGSYDDWLGNINQPERHVYEAYRVVLENLPSLYEGARLLNFWDIDAARQNIDKVAKNLREAKKLALRTDGSHPRIKRMRLGISSMADYAAAVREVAKGLDAIITGRTNDAIRFLDEAVSLVSQSERDYAKMPFCTAGKLRVLHADKTRWENMILCLRGSADRHSSDGPPAEALGRIERVLNGFDKMARQVRLRHSARPTIAIEDEYDVQDLLHGLLVMEFEGVRKEEWAPSYAGSSSRMDFLLKAEHIVIEVKRTRSGLADKEIGEQLILDADHYRGHPDCKQLVCFIYDPERRIRNPRGLEQDLTGRSDDELKVAVFVRPL